MQPPGVGGGCFITRRFPLVASIHASFAAMAGQLLAVKIVVDQYNFFVLEEDVTYTQVSAGGDRTALM